MTPSQPARPLVVLAHGTASAAGRAVAETITERAGAALGVPARLGFVDVCAPTAQDALAGLTDAVVVPLFLATGFHVRTDVPSAVAAAPGAVATEALGSGAPVIDVLTERIHEVSTAPSGVVLTAAGSSDELARGEILSAARLLADRLCVPVEVAYLSASPPRIDQAYARLEPSGAVVASHLLAPGHFQDRLAAQAAALGLPATAPLGAHPRLTDAVVARYREGATLRRT